MDSFVEEYPLCWGTADIGMYFDNQEFDSLGLDETLSSYYDYDSSSPDGCASSMASKNIVSERNRRKKLNERLYNLRAVVPNISKMDKASIIKDAINYIKELHEQERRIKSDISDLEYRRSKNGIDNTCSMMDYEQELPGLLIKSKKKRTDHRKQHYDSNGCCRTSINDLEVRVSYVGERTIVVSLTCSKREGTMVKLCEMFESLKLKIITAHITAFAGRLLKTVFLENSHEAKKSRSQGRILSVYCQINDALLAVFDINHVYETEFRAEWCRTNSTAAPCFLFARKFSQGVAMRLLSERWLQ